MRILFIAPFLPVPGILDDNDVLFKTADEYREKFPEDTFQFLKPQQYANRALGVLSPKLKQYDKIIRQGSYRFGDHEVDVAPYVTKRSMPLAHSVLSASLFYGNLAYARGLSRSVDLLHPQHIYPDGLFAYQVFRRYGIPYVLTVRTETDYFSIATRRTALAIVRNARQVITLSPRVRDYLREAAGIATRLVPHGVDEAFLVPHREVTEARPIRLLSAGRLLQLKNIDRVLRALAGLRHEYSFTYTILGDGPEREPLEHLAAQLGLQDRVRFTGVVPYEQIPGIMADHDLFVLPSFPEVFGRVYLEAMAAGLPLVHGRHTGIDGFYEPTAPAGIAVAPTDEVEIRNALTRLMGSRELRVTMAEAGRRLAAQCTWPRLVETFHGIYHAAMNPLRA